MVIQIPTIGFELSMSGGFAIMFVSLVGMGLLWLYKKGREDGRKETAKEIMEPIIERD